LTVDPNGDPVLEAEPVFHKQTPGGVESVAVPFAHALSNLPELLKDLTENSTPSPHDKFRVFASDHNPVTFRMHSLPTGDDD
jgi:hypothetical protein